jgi:hypothetical protein
MAMKGKSDDLKAVTNIAFEKQLRTAAKAALKKADRFWRLVEKAPSESYRELHMKQAREASTLSADKTRQGNVEQKRMKKRIVRSLEGDGKATPNFALLDLATGTWVLLGTG